MHLNHGLACYERVAQIYGRVCRKGNECAAEHLHSRREFLEAQYYAVSGSCLQQYELVLVIEHCGAYEYCNRVYYKCGLVAYKETQHHWYYGERQYENVRVSK